MTILERLVLHMLHERAAVVCRGCGELEHGSAVVWESGGCLVLVLVLVQGVITPYSCREGGIFFKKFDSSYNNFFSVWEH